MSSLQLVNWESGWKPNPDTKNTVNFLCISAMQVKYYSYFFIDEHKSPNVCEVTNSWFFFIKYYYFVNV